MCARQAPGTAWSRRHANSLLILDLWTPGPHPPFRWPAADAYVNGWIAALEGGKVLEIALGTVEVQSVSGRTLGLIVTPLHRLRFAWHGVYDQLAAHARYEQGLAPAAVQKSMKALDSAHFPAALPGIPPGPGFVFADTIGFHAVAMTLDGEPEPKAAVSLMSACLGGGVQAVAPSIGTESAAVLAARSVTTWTAIGGAGRPTTTVSIC